MANKACLRSLTTGARLCNNCYMDAKDEQPLTDVLRKAILESGISFKALEIETGVLRQSLMKFVRSKQSLRLDMADKLAVYFGLELKRKRKGR
jgi:plasmid maintenance system antidote protein VapI